jgi:hypothetical protein
MTATRVRANSLAATNKAIKVRANSMEATNKAAVIKVVVGIKVKAIRIATIKAAAVTEDAALASLARATLLSIVGATAAAGIPAPHVFPSKTVIRTTPPLQIRWAAAPGIVRCDIWGQKQVIIQLIITKQLMIIFHFPTTHPKHLQF